jgi:ubiquinone/menaquinone biosynthesis C-methylase UbiE
MALSATETFVREVQSTAELVFECFSLAGKVVVDVGCGTGDLVRRMAGRGALVTGIDTAKMLERAGKNPPTGGEKYLVGGAEALPLPDHSADLILYIASFHHVPEDKEFEALEECLRVLKPQCHAFFVEPIARPDSYYQITRLIEDEAEIQAKAYQALMAAGRLGLQMKSEVNFFVARSFADYQTLLEIFVEDDQQRNEVRERARGVTERLCADARISFEEYRYRSMCRAMLFEKTGRPYCVSLSPARDPQS